MEHTGNNNNIIIIIPDLFYMDWPGSCMLAKARAYRGPLHGWHCRILINAFLVRNRGISPRMKTPRTLRRPLHGIEPATRTALRGIPSSANASTRSAMEAIVEYHMKIVSQKLTKLS